MLDALDAYASAEALNRPDAIRAILADWLRMHGYGPETGKRPEGPAARVVAEMDAAIKEHRKAKGELRFCAAKPSRSKLTGSLLRL